MTNTRINPFRLAREAITTPIQEKVFKMALQDPPPAIVLESDRRPRPKKPTVDLETIRVLLYLSTSPRLTKLHRDACRQAAELLR